MSAEPRPNPSPIDQILEARAARVFAYAKERARAFARRPLTLDAVFPGLSNASPETMIAVAHYLLENERRSPRRWFGFGGEIPAVNARAILVLARARRRGENRSTGN